MTFRFTPNHLLILRPLPPVLADKECLKLLIEAGKKYLAPVGLPVSWNLPGFLFEPEEDPSILKLGKIESFEILSAGYTGRPHHLMKGEEIPREIDRGIETLSECLKESDTLDFSLPYYPDFEKTDSKEIYYRDDILLLSRGREQLREYRLHLPGGRSIQAEILGRRRNRKRSLSLKKNLQNFRIEKKYTVLIMEFPTPASILPVERKMSEFLRLYGKRKFMALNEFITENMMTTEKDDYGELPFWSPGWREYSETGLTEKRPIDPPHQKLIADMLGSVAMEDKNFTVHFDQGRWTGISRKGKTFLSRRRAECFFHINGKELPFLPPAAYSFDSAHSRGLREIQRFILEEGEEGKIVTDYFFTDEYPCIVMSVTSRFPHMSDTDLVDSFGIMEITLFEADEDELPLIVDYSRRSPGIFITASFTEPGDYHMSGSEFRFRLKEKIFLLSLPEEGPEIITVPLRINREGGKLIIMINPWGSYDQLEGSELSGLTEHFTLLLEAGLKNEISGKKPPRERYPGEAPFRIGRRGSHR